MGRGKRTLGRRGAPMAVDADARLSLLSGEVKPGRAMSPRGRARYALAAVRYAAALEPGDVLSIEAGPKEAELAVAMALEAYRAGARRVRVFSDRDALREMEEALGGAPGVELRSARDGEAWDEDVASGAAFVCLNEGAEWDEDARRLWDAASEGDHVRWSTVYWPTDEVAELVYPGDPEALRKLGDDLLHFARSGPGDAPDAYARHLDTLRRRASALNELELTSVVLESGGTRLEVGLLDTSEFRPTEWETSDGRRFAANVPSEEIFCTPDPSRVDGVFETTRPSWVGSLPVYRIRGRFRNGQLEREGFETEPEAQAEAVYQYLAANPGLLAVGELALVGDDSRVSESGRTYYMNNVDENAGCHLGLGESYRAGLKGLADDPRRNRQPEGHHHDLTVSGAGADVYGKTADGRLVPLIVQGRWQL